MPEPIKTPKVMRLDVTEEEMKYLILSINLTRSVMTNDWAEQIGDTLRMQAYLYGSQDEESDKRIQRLNDFRVKIARLFAGDAVVDQALKDMESKASAEGYKKCPDCGGYHA